MPSATNKVVNSSSPESSASYKSAFGDVSFIGTALVWATDQSGRSIYFTNQGQAFQEQSTGFAGDSHLAFIDPRIGFAFSFLGDQARFWRTNDGGQSWQKVNDFDQKSPDFQLTSLQQLHFVDQQHGWLVDVFGVWNTADGGVHWKNVFPIADHTDAGELIQGAFTGPAGGMVLSTHGIYITNDSGETWRQTSKDNGFTAIYALDKKVGWVWSDGIQRTTDGGKTWSQLYTTEAKIRIMSLQFINRAKGWATGVEVSDSFGSSVRNKNADNPWHGVLLHTTNGGKDWSKLTVPTDQAFDRVFFSDSQNGWLLGMRRIYRTIDGGITWKTALDL
jgi:photosystem II stability/assembly factor-like uncharacterized protein